MWASVQSLIKVSFICDFLYVSESTKSRRPQVLATGRHADEGRESAEDEGGWLINSARRQREKKVSRRRKGAVTRADRNRGRWEQDRWRAADGPAEEERKSESEHRGHGAEKSLTVRHWPQIRIIPLLFCCLTAEESILSWLSIFSQSAECGYNQ